MLPSFLVKAKTVLNEDASLQYQNTWKEFYIVVIDEPKSEVEKAFVENESTDVYSFDIKGYSDLLMDSFEQGVSVTRKSEIIDTSINNMPARLITINGKVDDIDAFYSIAYIEGEKRFYQIITWTLSEKEKEHKDKMNKIIHSFNEL